MMLKGGTGLKCLEVGLKLTQAKASRTPGKDNE